MRILHYNILDGGQARLPGLLRWIAAQNADVACLVELNGWDKPPGIAAHAAACGFAYSELLVGHSEYLIGVMAREKIEVIDKITQDLHHGIMHVKIGGVDYFCTHYSPHSRDVRLREAAFSRKLIEAVRGPLILLGDLNSHSPLDEALCAAFCTEKNRAWAMDFAAQQCLLDGGLIDLVRRDGQQWSLPTGMGAGGLGRRVDYIYANQAFMNLHPQAAAHVVHEEEVKMLSDHWPVICDAP